MIRQGKTKFPYNGNEEKFEQIFAKIQKQFQKETIDREEGETK